MLIRLLLRLMQVASPGFTLASLEEHVGSTYIVHGTKDEVLLVLRSDASSADVFKSAVHAQVLAALLARSAHSKGAITDGAKVRVFTDSSCSHLLPGNLHWEVFLSSVHLSF
jgi:hypothetical protein